MKPKHATRDLLETLERIEERARRAREGFDCGRTVNGRTAIRDIEEQAADALHRARARTGVVA